MTKKEKEIFNMIQNSSEGITKNELINKTGLKRQGIERYLKSLMEQNLIEKDNKIYFVKEENKTVSKKTEPYDKEKYKHIYDYDRLISIEYKELVSCNFYILNDKKLTDKEKIKQMKENYSITYNNIDYITKKFFKNKEESMEAMEVIKKKNERTEKSYFISKKITPR